MTVGEISCPSVNKRMALGVVDQGSASTPFYRSRDNMVISEPSTTKGASGTLLTNRAPS